MSNLVNTKFIYNNESVASIGSLLGPAAAAPKTGEAGFDGVLNGVKKRLSGQVDATAGGNSLPPGALCIIPIGPSINVLTSGKSEWSDETIREFARKEGLNPGVLGLIMQKSAPGAGRQSPGGCTDGLPDSSQLSMASVIGDPALMALVAHNVPLAGGAAFANSAEAAYSNINQSPAVAAGPFALPGRPGGAVPAWAATSTAEAGARTAVSAGLSLQVATAGSQAAGGINTVNTLAVVGGVANEGVRPEVGALTVTPGANVNAQRQFIMEHAELVAVTYTDAGLQSQGRAVVPPVPAAFGLPLKVEGPVAVASAAAGVLNPPDAAVPPVAGAPAMPLKVEGRNAVPSVAAGLSIQADAAVPVAGSPINAVATASMVPAELVMKFKGGEQPVQLIPGVERVSGRRSDALVSRKTGDSMESPGSASPVWHEEIDLSQFAVAPAAPKEQGTAGSNDPATGGGDQQSSENALAEEKGRQDRQYLKLSEQLMDVVGKRISDQVVKGVWQMSFQLRPARMGRIDVQLGMTNGEVEAAFTSSQADTQRLLEGGLDRLRGALEGAGLNVGRLFADGGAMGGEAQSRQQSGNGAQVPVAGLAQEAPQPAVKGVSAALPLQKLSAEGVDLFI
ncbi:MAG: flagellar hook-length control protein FliK [bacterium]